MLFCFASWYFADRRRPMAPELTVAVMKSEGNFPVEDILTGFKMEMQQSNITVHLVHMEGGNNFSRISSQIVRTRQDMLLCIGVKALEQAVLIKHIPKLYSMVTYENAQVWLDRNDVFGVSLDIAPLIQFRIIRQALPASKRIGVLYDPEHNRKLIEEAKKQRRPPVFHLLRYRSARSEIFLPPWISWKTMLTFSGRFMIQPLTRRSQPDMFCYRPCVRKFRWWACLRILPKPGRF